VLRLSGITCEARYNGDGTVTVRGHLGDSQALAAIVNSRAIREIVGLKRVMAVNLDQAGRSAQGPVDGTRIVSVVASADPYVVTADGSRYYVGASLPQGGRLAGVKEGEVLVERDGRTEHWKIAEPGHGSGEFRPTTNFLTDSAAMRRRR
jgi:type III secretion protein D